jgi:hypothetical protein
MYKISRSNHTTNEEKVAVKIAGLINDFSLDLNAVGKYLCTAVPHISYMRAVEILEAMQYNKDVAEYREIGKYYGNNIHR